MPQLCEKYKCTGCTACASICPKGCISLIADEFEFLYPQITEPEKCVNCGLCMSACPILSASPLPGMPQAFAAMAKDTDLRLQSSSGGVFSLFAQEVLEQGGVVYGAAYDESFVVRHICVETEDKLSRLRGAKYAQSDLGQTFAAVKEHLHRGRQVLFSGTPCQISGLKSFLQKDYKNLLTVDFVCHSVPSPMVWREYVKFRALQDSNGELPIAINLRSKHTGWSRYQYTNLFEYTDGHSHRSSSGESLYMKLFGGGYISRESCANCQFKGYSRISDLTIGDFWGIWDIAPEMDDNKGTSLILVQSERGTALLNQLKDTLILAQMAPENTSQQNQAMLKAASPSDRRSEALCLIQSGNIAACESWFLPNKQTRKEMLFSRVKRILKKVRKQ